MKTIIRRRRNKIHGLYIDGGIWNLLKREAKKFYENLFCIIEGVYLSYCSNITMPLVEGKALLSLTKLVKKVIFSMGS